MTDTEYLELIGKIRQLTDVDLHKYKSNQMRRRLEHFILSLGFQDIASFSLALEQDSTMVERLKDFLTINVSEFFRDPKYFALLMTDILPKMLKKRTRLNIWSAGCSNGAEAYSVAMILDHLSPLSCHRILATDIDRKCLDKARNGGPYSTNEIRNVPEEFLEKYFIASEDSYNVMEKIRQSVIFKQHDLLKDFVGSGFDLIICRNVLIYLTEEAKSELLHRFHHALKEDGILFLGATEIILDPESLGFTLYHACFYRKTNASKNFSVTLKMPALASAREGGI